MEPLRILAVGARCREARELFDLALARGHDAAAEAEDESSTSPDVVLVDTSEDQDPSAALERARSLIEGRDTTLAAVCTPEQALWLATSGVHEIVLVGSDGQVLQAHFELLERRAREARSRARTRAQLQKRAALALREANERLETKVRERTADLERINRELQTEIETRRRAEAARQAMESRLRLAEKLEALGQLAGGIAHDFNNQLVGVLGGAEVLLQASQDPEVVECAEMIRQSALNSSELIKRLLEFARRGPTRAEPLNLHQVVRDALALLTRSLGGGVALVTKLESQSPTVRGDEALLQHALLNLVLNARDALPTGGTVTIATSDAVLEEEDARSHGLSAGRYVQLSVSDDGVGMDEATRQRLFEPFYTTKADGTGLGLSVVYGTIQRHAGSIRVESALGKGAAFELLIPAVDATPRVWPTSGPVAAKRGCVLLADDEPHVRRATTAMLRSLGHDVSSCADGESAVAWVREHPDQVDVVLLDVVMPGLGGIGAHAAIRALAPGLPVVLMSGFAADGEVEKALADGARAFLSKPFTAEELTRLLDDCLDE